jgi:FixJ family two-component response regulator
MSRRTIENHRAAIKARLKAENLAELIKKPAKYGL